MHIFDEELGTRGLPGEITISVTPEEIEKLRNGGILEATGRETGLTVSICPQRTSNTFLTEVIGGEIENPNVFTESEMQRVAAEVRRRCG